jgi:hypothetical protein
MGELGWRLAEFGASNPQGMAGDWRFHNIRAGTEKSLQFVYSFLYVRGEKSMEFN